MYEFVAEGKPRTKGRPRLGRGRRAYTPKATHEAENLLASFYDGPCFDSHLRMEVEYHRTFQVVRLIPVEFANESRLTGDLDNYLKLTADALNGKAYADDKQIVQIEAVRL